MYIKFPNRCWRIEIGIGQFNIVIFQEIFFWRFHILTHKRHVFMFRKDKWIFIAFHLRTQECIRSLLLIFDVIFLKKFNRETWCWNYLLVLGHDYHIEIKIYLLNVSVHCRFIIIKMKITLKFVYNSSRKLPARLLCWPSFKKP